MGGSATRQATATAVAALAKEQQLPSESGTQLLAVARGLSGSAQLQAVLADSGIEPARKAQLVERVFGGLGAGAARLVTTAVSSRWSSQSDLVDGIEELGIRALVGSAGDSLVDVELLAIVRAVQADGELQLALDSKLGDQAAKAALLRRLFGATVSEPTLALAEHLVQSLRGRRVRSAFARAADIAAAASNRLVAAVTSAAPLDAAQLERIASALESRYGRRPAIDLAVDPSLVGGVRIQVGGDVVDLSVASRLHRLRLDLAG